MFAAPAPCAGNLLIAPSCDGVLYALNRRTGRPIWEFRGAGKGYHSSPAVEGKTVFVGNDDGRVYAIELVSGDPLWTVETGAPIWSKPLIAPGLVVFGTLGGHLFAVRRTDGAVLWRTVAGKSVYLSDPSRWRDQVVVGTTDGAVSGFDLESGRRAWSFRTRGAVAGGPAIEGDLAWFGTRGGLCAAMDLRKRRPVWARKLRGGTIYAPALLPSSLLVGTGAGMFYALDKASGEVLWTLHIGKRAGCPATDGRRAFLPGWDGVLRAVSAAEGKVLWTLTAGADIRGFVSLDAGWLFVGSLDRALYAVKYM
jgi:outer membrane protein assembly factor BamB